MHLYYLIIQFFVSKLNSKFISIVQFSYLSQINILSTSPFQMEILSNKLWKITLKQQVIPRV